MTAQHRKIAVFDIGKTNVKIVLHDGATGQDLFVRTMPNVVVAREPYPHFDTARIEDFLLDGLVDMQRDPDLIPDAVSITTHGAAAALIGPESLALPVLDYEYAGPDALAEAYDAIRPDFTETCSPRLPAGLNVGAQFFWQARQWPSAWASATAIVTYPQYWSWRLTGRATTEPTSLGAHTDLWAPRRRGFSSLVDRLGIRARLAPLHSAFDVLGPVKPALAARLGLGRPLPVTCGIHDSNASLLPHLQSRQAPFTVVSTGTWAIVFAVGGSLDGLDPERDTLANVDAFRRPTPAARFMGGREFDLLVGGPGATVTPDAATLAAVVERGIMALPTFAPGNGPYPRGRGRWSHDPAGLNAAERTAAASLYVALMTATCLDLLAAEGPTIIEGPFAANGLFRAALARRSGRPVLCAPGSTGTSAGAARLALPPQAWPLRAEASRAAPLRAEAAAPDAELGPAFDAYADHWRRCAAATF